ncbi:MAG: amino acid racemase [Patescibacteria group bacterium]
MNEREKAIGVCGGVGQAAGNELCTKYITPNCDNGGSDAGQISLYHIARAVPDRTEFLLGREKRNPADEMIATIRAIRAAVDTAEGKEKGLVAGVPCNTFHAPAVWDRFVALIKNEKLNVELVHMLRETAAFVKANFPEMKKIGLMSTTGTRQVGVYRAIFEPLGFEIVEVPEANQSELHDTIYNQQFGIKAINNPVTPQARANFEKYVALLKDGGAEAVILGCTEIPLALPEKDLNGTPLIDPMLALARALIREANRQKLVPLLGK